MSNNNALSCIQNLRMLLTHPDFIYTQQKKMEESPELQNEGWAGSLDLFPDEYEANLDCEYSGKLHVLHKLLAKVKEANDRVVLVSNFTSVRIKNISKFFRFWTDWKPF